MENINFVLVFLEGILSFFSPCIFPLLPIYLGYLAGNGKRVEEDSSITYERKTVFLNTLLFVLGISFAFFILGMSFSVLGSFFQTYKRALIITSGVLIIIMGMMQLGIFKISFFQKEHKLKTRFNLQKMNPILAFLMGFTFSFAWTPCIGPVLSSVLVLASSSASIGIGNLLVLLYSLGFIIPFLLLGIFTTKLLNLLRKKQKFIQYTIKISGVILILIGILTITGKMEGIIAYFNTIGGATSKEGSTIIDNKQEDKLKEEVLKEQNSSKIDMFPFTLLDQYGKEHKLEEYKGKVIFLNFWTTWCPHCKKELPYLEELYQEYGKNEKEVIFLGIANPKTETNPYGNDVSRAEIEEFLKKYSITFPVVFDETGRTLLDYQIQGFPTSFCIDKQGKIVAYIPGGIEKESMQKVIQQVLKED